MGRFQEEKHPRGLRFRKTADSPFKNFQSTDKQLIIQGVENDHGWTMAISKETGRMSLAVVGEEVSFTIFGACKAL